MSMTSSIIAATALAMEPAMSPPPGEVSNFVDPPNIVPAIIGGLTVCTAIATLSLAVRLYAQWTLFHRFIWADACTVIGWAFQISFVGLLYACIPYGAGRHLWDVTKEDFKQINFLLFIDYIVYGCAITGPKISILLQLITVFVPRGRDLSLSSRAFYWSAVAMIAVNLLFYVPHNFILIFQCTPVAKGWDKTIPGTCLNQFILIRSSGPFNIASDFLIFLLPLSVIWRLQLPIRTRLSIVSAFAIGLFGCVCSGVRFYYSDKLTTTGDVTYLVFQNQLWANAEITTAIIIANIIILPRFIRYKRGLATTASQKYAAQYGSATAGNGNYRLSKHRSMGSKHRSMAFNRNSKYVQPHDPYMELADVNSTICTERTRVEGKEDIELDLSDGSPPRDGIVRTVCVESSEETLEMPPRALMPSGRPTVITEVAGRASSDDA